VYIVLSVGVGAANDDTVQRREDTGL
jgi:hypothetical protein